MNTSPLPVPELPAFDPADWESAAAAFANAPKWEFGQGWAERLAEDFAGGCVRIGWRADHLAFLADLDDRDLFTTATKRNQNLWELGDVLEIFAGLHGNPGYIEHHTAPDGMVLQLFWPDSAALATVHSAEDLDRFKRTDESCDARVFVRAGGWRVLGRVSAAAVGLAPGTPLNDQILDLNFGRYDRGSDGNPPVLSSTSPLTRAAYHRRHEWRTIRLVPDEIR